MANRGLNKGRGLGALIPQRNKAKADAENTAAPAAGEATENKTPTNAEETEKEEAPAPTKDHNKAAEAAQAPTADETTPRAPKAAPAAGDNLMSTGRGLQYVRLTDIVPSRKQPRKVFDEEPIRELAESIKAHGIVTPLLVRKKGAYFELIAGERRWRAAKRAGLKEAPVILREFTEQQAMEIALIDNLQREDLNAIEEARAYQSLIDEFGLTQERLAQRVSKSRAAVTNAIRLLRLEPDVQNMLIDGALTMGHARALLAIDDPSLQRSTAERIRKSGASVRETEALVRQLLHPRKRKTKAPVDPQIAAVYADLEERLRKSLGTRVSIVPLRGKKGKVEIEYYSNDDLERILDRLR